MLLSEVWSLFQEEKKLEFSPYTMKSYKLQMNLLIRDLGDRHIQEIYYIHLKQYINRHAERLKKSTLGCRVRFIRSVFKWAHDEGITKTNESAKLKEPKQGMRVPKFIKDEDIERLRESAKGAKEKLLINLLYSSGCRIGEIQGMNIKDINFEQRYITVIGKGNKEREAPFDNKTYIWLKEYLGQRNDDLECLFPTDHTFKENDGKPRRLSKAQLRYIVKRIAKRANIDVSIYPHRFRHSFCTHLMDRGAPMEVISSLAGHQKIETTRIYAALSGERRRELYKKYF
ncbi:tyrosine-type recombinase/integrase [Gracilibacillus sp. YIM 98692]|uniref:tyrosine-type recombinase/integrase n=1 Tax=Gracilibacillus sp. YIM 98692 TaxID=2663532 RepID=UPI0013D3A3CF|nr:tyrosine-type recombinase/integrase [Gracilibacillus sp. YIM 98692]